MKTRKKRIYFDHKVNPDHLTNIYDPFKKRKLVRYILLFIGVTVATALLLFSLGIVSEF